MKTIVNLVFPFMILLRDLEEKMAGKNKKRVAPYPFKFEWLRKVFARSEGGNVVCAMQQFCSRDQVMKE